MSLAIDEYGQPFLIMKEQEKKRRLKGTEALKANILAAQAVAGTLKTSLGPRGMDKILVSPDGDASITNDGAEILRKMDVEHEVGKLFAELSRSQDDEIGDGTTGVVVLAGALLAEALPLVEKGIHPLVIAKSFDRACEVAVQHLEAISESFVEFSNDGRPHEPSLVRAAKTTLCSKFVSSHKDHLARIAVAAVLAVADLARRDVNLEMVRVEGKVGSSLDQSSLYDGIVLEKSMAHSQMKKSFKNAKIALLTCAFEPPKPKTKHFVLISSVEQYNQLHEQEQQYFRWMVRRCKDSGADVVFCQWGFDDEANHLLLAHEMPAVRWVGGGEMEMLSIATGANIVGRFEDLSADKLGTAGSIKEISLGNLSDKLIIVENCPNIKAQTIFLRAGNKMALDEAKRCINDALFTVRNLIVNERICYGGGSCELSCALEVEKKGEKIKGLAQYGFEAFGRALRAIPLALAENGGLNAIEKVAEIERRQVEEKNPFLGVGSGEGAERDDMKAQEVLEPFISKRSQILLATQLAKIILKTDDIIQQSEDLY